MPTLLRFHADPIGLRTAMPRHTGDIAHGNVFRWLFCGDTGFGAATHGGDGRKPFSLGLIESVRKRQIGLRVGVLRDEMLPVIRAGLGLQPWLQIVRDRLALVRVDALADLPYDALPDSPVTGAVLQFETPTLFKVGSDTCAMPDPWHMMQSWAQAWESNAPAHLTLGSDGLCEFLAWVRRGITLVSAQVSAAESRIERETRRGFCGDVQLAIETGDAMAKHASRLVHYAPFCGTGYKTSHGLGQTTLSVINPEAFHATWRAPQITRGRTPVWLNIDFDG